MTSTNAFTELCPGCFAEKGTVNICHRCGYDESLKRGPLVLAHRTLLHHGQYLIGKVLGKPGGFGITYLALDTKLETRVAIKEYLPRDLAGRDGDHATINAHSAEDGEHFRYGLTQFLQEARTLAQFDHANIVRVRNFFEENGTGYLVMDYYDGITLAGYLAQQPQGKLPEKAAVDILMPILDGLREVHAKNFLHRDIKPQNIYLTTGNHAILLDFGAARQAMGERSRSLSVVLSEGYAPYEQYHRRGQQGPWTDIYACAAVLYHAVAGEPPPPATERIPKDELDIAALGLSASLTKALQLGLATDHNKRPQRMKDFQALLLESGDPIKPTAVEQKQQRVDLPAPAKIAPSQSVSPTQVGVALALLFLVSIGIAMLVNANKQDKKTATGPNIAVPVAVQPVPPIVVTPVSIQCKVNDKDIAESYTGECKDGLAHGQGIAKGRDEYRGSFVNGNKEGLGVYIWGINSEWSGQRYEGSNKNDERHDFGAVIVAKNSKNTRMVEYFKKIGKDEGDNYVLRGYSENGKSIFRCDSEILCKKILNEIEKYFNSEIKENTLKGNRTLFNTARCLAESRNIDRFRSLCPSVRDVYMDDAGFKQSLEVVFNSASTGGGDMFRVTDQSQFFLIIKNENTYLWSVGCSRKTCLNILVAIDRTRDVQRVVAANYLNNSIDSLWINNPSEEEKLLLRPSRV